jgi:hypothetical protein
MAEDKEEKNLPEKERRTLFLIIPSKEKTSRQLYFCSIFSVAILFGLFYTSYREK